ncbi:MAG: TonB-dependent receptor, partial [Pseudomonadota bacterium]|nr:TonB-dependent receptor [Pseudomonadota bacterium]
DILNVPDPVQQGFGYFQNVGATQRQGIEAQINYRRDRFTASASYAFLDATFLNALQLGSNSPFADANGNIHVSAGNQIPLSPHHRLKLLADYEVTPAFRIGADVNIVGPQYFAGDASNQFSQLPAYWVADADASYQVTKTVQLYTKIENVFGNRYYTYGTFFNTAAVPNYYNGGAPFTDPRSLTPARPRAFYAGMKATF